MCIAARKGDVLTKKASDIQQAKDAFAFRLMAVRNMLTPRGMPMQRCQPLLQYLSEKRFAKSEIEQKCMRNAC